MPVPRLARWLLAEGVTRVIVTTDDKAKYRGVSMPGGVEVWDRARIVEAQEVLRDETGVTVLIHDQQCAAEKRRDRKRGTVADPATRIVINERVCEGCGDCGAKSNCLSVQPIDTEFGRKTQIHQSSCNKDYSCLDGDCPSFLSVIPKKAGGKTSRAKGGARRIPKVDAELLVEPTPIVPTDDATIRMPGVGGTGVVTVSQILGTAATLDDLGELLGTEHDFSDLEGLLDRRPDLCDTDAERRLLAALITHRRSELRRLLGAAQAHRLQLRMTATQLVHERLLLRIPALPPDQVEPQIHARTSR